MTTHSVARRGITFLPLVMATYFIVSGGPYGLEDLLAQVGYSRALEVLLLTPLFWSLPTALMVGELADALPEEGGYYVWVRRALGRFWGFQEAWLSLAASVFDMAIYPTLFTLYLGQLVPSLGHGAPAFAMGALVIVGATLWNLRGAEAVGRSTLLFGAAVLTPFFVLAFAGLGHASSTPAHPVTHGSLALGLLVAMWNFMGWDNASTFASSVDRPQRTYPWAMVTTVLLVTGTYVLPVLGVWHAGVDARAWKTGAWATAAGALVGPGLELGIVLGGMISGVATFNALLLSYSRVPARLAEDGLFPALFARRSKDGTPWVAVLLCSTAYLFGLTLGFEKLVVLDVVIYGVSLVLEFAALVALRLREPALPRPFKIPGGLAALLMLGAGPLGLILFAAVSSVRDDPRGLWLAAALLCAGPLVYLVFLHRARRAGRLAA